MKNLFTILILWRDAAKRLTVFLLFSLSFAGCLTTTNEIPITMELSASALRFQHAGGQQSLTVTSNTNNWTVASNASSWLAVTPEAGSNNGMVTITAAPNTETSLLTATITVSGTGIGMRTIDVEMEGVPLRMTVALSSLNFAAAGEQKSFDVASNTAWEVSHDAPSWLTVSPTDGMDGGTVTVTAEANPVVAQRTATITISSADLEAQSISVTQDGALPMLTVSTNTFDFRASSEQKAFNISSNIPWTVSSSASWLTLSPENGSNDGMVIVTTEANSTVAVRTAIITVSGTDVAEQYLFVTQEGTVASPVLTLSTNSMNFASAGEQHTFTIEATTSWTVEPTVAWLTVTPTSGRDNSTVTVTALANPIPTIRTGAITVTGTGVPPRIINVSQAPLIEASWAMSATMTAVLDASGHLSITTTAGTESMPDYWEYSRIPWNNVRANIRSVSIGDGVTTIGEQAFSNCASLASITFAGSVKSIGNRAFYNCTSLVSVALPNSVTTIGTGAFFGCRSLATFSFGYSVTTIGIEAFYQCLSLVSISLPHSLTMIGSSAFLSCTSLDNIAIPYSVTVIGNNAFAACAALQTVTVEWDTPLIVPENIFTGSNPSTAILRVPFGRRTSYETADVWKNFGTIIEY